MYAAASSRRPRRFQRGDMWGFSLNASETPIMTAMAVRMCLIIVDCVGVVGWVDVRGFLERGRRVAGGFR